MAHNVGKHASAKEERKVFYARIYHRSTSVGYFQRQSCMVLLFLNHFWLMFYVILTAEEAAHWEETKRENKQLSGSAERNCDWSFQTGCKYVLTCLNISTCKQQVLDQVLTLRWFMCTQQSKLEKADILEMTVKHLQNIQSNKIHGKEQWAPVTCGVRKPCNTTVTWHFVSFLGSVTMNYHWKCNENKFEVSP